MAELATVARPYAEALFRVAQAGNLDAWSELVSELAQVAAHPDVNAVIDSPNVTDAQLADLFLAALKSPVNDEVKSFVRLVAQYGRLALLPEIAAQFHVLKNASAGVADIEITSAFALDAAQQQDLVAALERKFGKKLNPTVVVDPSLIGGVRVQVGDEVLDTSVRARLAAMHGALTA